MEPERWQRVKSLLQDSLELEPGARRPFLQETCDDADVRAEVESLLSSHEEAGDFIESPAVASTLGLYARASSTAAVAEPKGRRLGPYKLLKEIGRGGMGSVYRAVRADDEFERLVAIKIVRIGLEDDFVRKRFRNERQILASLDHPNIARLLDGGTTEEGTPYLVMEYIEGQPLHEYCDERRLGIPERVRLFRQVCSAVSYAHQNLIVHRDLKPSNILVCPDGTPKLLDFGIAKILNASLAHHAPDPTATLMRLMTLDYASPEQVRGGVVTTSSDVYSLGVVLYELLAGHRPYRLQGKQTDEIVRVICEEEPNRPSTAVTRVTVDGDGRTPEMVGYSREATPEKLRRALCGDLDNIVLMAMRKEPQRRYASAEALSEDLRRYLDGLPIKARKDTVGYRTSKFVRRNRAGVVAAGLVAASLVAGLAATTWQARLASQERARAERRFNDVRHLANAVLGEIYNALEPLPGSTGVRELVVQRGLQYLDSLAQETTNDPGLLRELALAYRRVGDVQGRPSVPNLGNSPGALESYRKGLAIRERLVREMPDSVEDRRELAASHGRISAILQTLGDAQGALESDRKALTIRQEIASADPNSVQNRMDLSAGYQDVGISLGGMNDWVGARDQFRKCLEIRQELALANRTSAPLWRSLGLAHRRLGAALLNTGEHAESMVELREAAKIEEDALARTPEGAQARLDLSFTLTEMGNVLTARGDLAGAMAQHQRALALRQAAVRDDPKDARARRAMAVSYGKVGEVLLRTGDFTGALQSHQEAAALHEAVSAADPASGLKQAEAAAAYARVGDSHRALAQRGVTPAGARPGHWREARTWYARSLALHESLREQGKEKELRRQRDSGPGAAELRQRIQECERSLGT